MKQDIKISLKPYKMVYAVLFVFLLALVRGISRAEEIGITLEMMIPALAIVFCADTSYQEILEGRWEIFGLYPTGKQRMAVYRRLGIEVLFLILISALGYGLFMVFQKPRLEEQNQLMMFGKSMVAVGVGIFFFACLSEWLVSHMHSLWGGIGVCVILWQVMISSFSRMLPAPLQLICYSEEGAQEGGLNWLLGKLTALGLTALLLVFHGKTGKRKGLR